MHRLFSAEWNGFTDSPYGASLINFEPEYEERCARSLPNVGETVRVVPILFVGGRSFPYIDSGLAVDLCESAV